MWFLKHILDTTFCFLRVCLVENLQDIKEDLRN